MRLAIDIKLHFCTPVDYFELNACHAITAIINENVFNNMVINYSSNVRKNHSIWIAFLSISLVFSSKILFVCFFFHVQLNIYMVSIYFFQCEMNNIVRKLSSGKETIAFPIRHIVRTKLNGIIHKNFISQHSVDKSF